MSNANTQQQQQRKAILGQVRLKYSAIKTIRESEAVTGETTQNQTNIDKIITANQQVIEAEKNLETKKQEWLDSKKTALDNDGFFKTSEGKEKLTFIKTKTEALDGLLPNVKKAKERLGTASEELRLLLLSNVSLEPEHKKALEKIKGLYGKYFNNTDRQAIDSTVLKEAVAEARRGFIQAINTSSVEKVAPDNAEEIIAAFDAEIEALREVEKLNQQKKSIAGLEQARENKRVAQEEINTFKKSFEGKNQDLWAEIGNIVKSDLSDATITAKKIIRERRELREALECKLPEDGIDLEKKDAKEFLKKSRLTGMQIVTIEDLFEALLENNPEELKDIAPFKEIKSDNTKEDFEEQARKVFLGAKHEGDNLKGKQKIVVDIAHHLANLVKHKGDKKEAITASGKKVSDALTMQTNFQAGSAETIQSPPPEETPVNKALRSARAADGFALCVNNLIISDKKPTKSPDSKDITVDEIDWENDIKDGLPSGLKGEDIDRLQKKLIEEIKQLKADYKKLIDNASDNNKASLESELKNKIKNLEHNLLNQNGFLSVKNTEGKEVEGLYFCRKEGDESDDKKAVYVLVGNKENFRNQIDAIVANNRKFVDKDGNDVTVGYCNIIDIDRKQEGVAIEECLKLNSRFGFDGKEHPYSAALRDINAINNKNTDATPVITVLFKLPHTKQRWFNAYTGDEQAIHIRKFLELSAGNTAVKNRLEEDIKRMSSVLDGSGNILGSDDLKTVEKKAKIMLEIFKQMSGDYKLERDNLEKALADREKILAEQEKTNQNQNNKT